MSVSYIEFELFNEIGELNWQLTGLPDGSENGQTTGYQFALFEGSFGAFGDILAHDMNNGLVKELSETVYMMQEHTPLPLVYSY